MDLIGATTTKTGLARRKLGTCAYLRAISAPGQDMAVLNITCDELHDEWNCTTPPHEPEIMAAVLRQALEAAYGLPHHAVACPQDVEGDQRGNGGIEP